MDAGPNHFSVTTNGGCTFVPDRFGFDAGAISLNGSGQNLVIPFNTKLFPKEMTISVWVNFQQFSGVQLFRAGNASSDSWRGYTFGLDTPPGSPLNYSDYTGSGYNSSLNLAKSNFLSGVWYQIVVTRATNICSIFVNGQKLASQTSLIAYAQPQFAPLVVGANVNFDGSYFQYLAGALDAIHIYNRALSDSEVQTLYTTESINTNAVPSLGVVVKTIRVNMSQLVSNYVYQLQESADLSSWTNVSNSFTATNSGAYQDIDIITTGQGFFRILKSP